MELDADICYRAVRSRDPRFDGRFFTAVRTTGIYCRPVCPAVTPRRRNVAFFACAAAAEQAGFRPCRRCRPETAPGTPAWAGTSATVTRALREIGAGYLDAHTVDELAARLGIGPRHLDRLFDDHLGTSPVAVAQTRRVHFARQLVEHTAWPMSQVALAAGFGSVRRFNHLIRRTFGRTPSELRAGARAAPDSETVLTHRLTYRPPYAWDDLLDYLAGRAIPGVETATGGVYRRTVRHGDEAGWLEVSPVAGRHELRLRAWLPTPVATAGLVARVRRMFDCEADPAAIGAHLATDPVLAPRIAARPGLRLPCGWDPFETAVRTVLGQQVSVVAATTVSGRLVARCGEPITTPHAGLARLFPTPAALAGADLTGLGLTTRRAATVTALAGAVATGAFVLEAPRGPDDFIARMTALPGIGPWTANYVAMRALGEPDGFPAGDLGLRQAAPDLDLAAHSERWRPWRAYAALHLWAGPPPAKDKEP